MSLITANDREYPRLCQCQARFLMDKHNSLDDLYIYIYRERERERERDRQIDRCNAFSLTASTEDHLAYASFI